MPSTGQRLGVQQNPGYSNGGAGDVKKRGTESRWQRQFPDKRNERIVRHSRLVIDSRNAGAGVKSGRSKIVKA
jgi:hypothetical protein